MNFVLVKELEKNEFITVIVEDQMSKDQLFDDAEKNGWILVKEAEQIVVYDLVRRFSMNGEEFDEPAYLPDEQKTVESILEALLTEASFTSQQEEVEAFLKGDSSLEKVLLERKVKDLESKVAVLQDYKDQTVWRLTTEDFISIAVDDKGLDLDEAEVLVLDHFNIENWADYVSLFLDGKIEETKMKKENVDNEPGFNCPKCSSEDTETWLFERKQNCLDCKHEFTLSEKLAQELKKTRGVETYIMVWQGEEEKWYYFIDEFDKDQFTDGYVDYYVEVEEGLIIVDTYSPANEGKVFTLAYDSALWELSSK
ncbi:hypothetical protein [Psychrobacillus sp. FSL H8-0510]|uniref:hypothetical protein n=1 Tax=Psychrobacillus sp. FSL H8-0510 TaxID=2921394 RepID=UPI0030FB475C